MGQFRNILLLCLLLVATVHAEGEAEAESKTAEVVSAVVTSEPGVITKAENFFIENWKALVGILAIALSGGLGYFAYYRYYLQAATTNTAGYYRQGFYGYGRSLNTDNPWDFTKVLEYIEIAQKVYAGFDWQDLACQHRSLCEVVQTQQGSTGRRLSESAIYKVLNALDGIPIPRVIQVMLKEYKEAVDYGMTGKECGAKYSKCKFSVKEVLTSTKKKNSL